MSRLSGIIFQSRFTVNGFLTSKLQNASLCRHVVKTDGTNPSGSFVKVARPYRLSPVSYWVKHPAKDQRSPSTLTQRFNVVPRYCKLPYSTTPRDLIRAKIVKEKFSDVRISSFCKRWTFLSTRIPPQACCAVSSGGIVLPGQDRGFHTSPRNAVPPLLLIFAKQAAKVVSILGGRTFRKWWQSLTPERKQYYKDHIFKRRSLLAAAVGVLIFASVIHYFNHLQTTPVTKRRRYVALTPEQFKEIAEFELAVQSELAKDKLVHPDNMAYKRIVRIVQQIVNSNQDLEFMQNQNWMIYVIDSKEVNAFVLPTGHIFVNTGLLNAAQNDDQLAVVLGHEIAHALLSHGAEQLSFTTALDFVVIVVMAAIWAFMPSDGVAFIADWLYNRVVQIGLHLPYSRALELEADEVGLHLVAKACYDIRESTVFWSQMAINSGGEERTEVPQWISTHPASEFRAKKLDELIPMAIKERESCNCPALPSNDPRSYLVALRQQAEERKKKAVEGSKKNPVAGPIISPPNAKPIYTVEMKS